MPSQGSNLPIIKQECFEIKPYEDLNVLKRRYDRTKEKNLNLKEKLKSIEANIMQVNQKFVTDLEHQIKRLENEQTKKNSQLVKEKKKSLHLVVESKIKEEKIKSLTEERSDLLKKIDELNEMLARRKVQSDLASKSRSLNVLPTQDESSKKVPSRKSTSLITSKNSNKRSHSPCQESNVDNQNSASSSKKRKQSDSNESNRGNRKSNPSFSNTFNCKIEFLLNGKNVWESFAPKKRSKISAIYLKRREMNAAQRKECDILDNFMETFILKFYRIKTKTQAIFRTACGYTVKRYCHGCRSIWCLNLNIEIGEGEISCTNKCGHVLTQVAIGI